MRPSVSDVIHDVHLYRTVERRPARLGRPAHRRLRSRHPRQLISIDVHRSHVVPTRALHEKIEPPRHGMRFDRRPRKLNTSARSAKRRETETLSRSISSTPAAATRSRSTTPSLVSHRFHSRARSRLVPARRVRQSSLGVSRALLVRSLLALILGTVRRRRLLRRSRSRGRARERRTDRTSSPHRASRRHRRHERESPSTTRRLALGTVRRLVAPFSSSRRRPTRVTRVENVDAFARIAIARAKNVDTIARARERRVADCVGCRRLHRCRPDLASQRVDAVDRSPVDR